MTLHPPRPILQERRTGFDQASNQQRRDPSDNRVVHLHAIGAQDMTEYTHQLEVPDSRLQHLGCRVGQNCKADSGRFE
jgi:hypothetical protein